MSQEEINKLEALMDDGSEKAVARALEAATANGLAAQKNAVSGEVASDVATLVLLSALGGNKVRKEDSLKFEGNSFVVPAVYQNDIDSAIKFLKEYKDTQEAPVEITRVFDYRYHDVAHAVHLALKEVWGYTGKGVAIKTMFGDIEPAFLDVKTGINSTVQVPFNRLSFLPLHGHIDIGYTRHATKGFLGKIDIKAPRYLRDAVEGFYKVVEKNLREASIYRGKAFMLTPNNEIEFLDLSKYKREDVVYSADALAHIEANLWVVLRNMQLMRDTGQSIKRAILLEGPFGTGKSMTGYLTALEAVANDVTFIFVKPGADLNEAMQTAQLYAPAVVFFEDIDVLQSDDPEEVSRLLDTFDGLGGKGKEIVAVLTTNNKENIHKGMLRPGRLDSVIHIGAPDLEGVQKLVEVKLRQTGVELVDIDWAAVYEVCKDFMPAFVGEAAGRAFRYAMVRQGGKPTELNTDDLVNACKGLRDQHDLMLGAHEVQPPETLTTAMEKMVAKVLENSYAVDGDGDKNWAFSGFRVNQ